MTLGTPGADCGAVVCVCAAVLGLLEDCEATFVE